MAAILFPPTILLVDDDPIVHFLLRRLVHRQWPLVHMLDAENGEQGLALVQAHCQATTTPCSLLVLLDLNMPVLNGLGFLRQFRLLPTHCQQAATVVVSSTSKYPEDLAQAETLASAYWPKPLRLEDLAQLLHQYLPAALAA